MCAKLLKGLGWEPHVELETYLHRERGLLLVRLVPTVALDVRLIGPTSAAGSLPGPRERVLHSWSGEQQVEVDPVPARAVVRARRQRRGRADVEPSPAARTVGVWGHAAMAAGVVAVNDARDGYRIPGSETQRREVVDAATALRSRLYSGR